MAAPFGMGDGSGKWLDPDQLMQYTVLQAQALLNGGAVTSPTPAVAFGQKCNSDVVANGPAKKFKKKQSNGSGFKGQEENAAARTDGERAYSTANKICWHCKAQGHASSDCEAKKAGEPAAPMPASFKKQLNA